MREPTALPSESSTELAPPDTPPRRLRDDHENGVLGLAQAALLAQLSSQMRGQLGSHPVKAPPGALLTTVQPLGFHGTTVPEQC